MRLTSLALGALLVGAAFAATTDLSNAPLFTSSSNAVKPNIMFILDDSGSMASDYLPDEANFSTSKYGKNTYQCNGVGYNPSTTYNPPVDSTGASLPVGSLAFITFDPTSQTQSVRTLSNVLMPLLVGTNITVTVTSSNRKTSWYSTPSTPTLGPPSSVTVFQNGDSSRYFWGTVQSWDSSTGNMVITIEQIVGLGTFNPARIGNGQPIGSTYYKYTGTQPRLSYTYTSSGVITSTNFYKECNSSVGSTPGSGVFTAVNMLSTSPDAQNYANWYKYYRTRMSMMKTSVSLAFKGIDSRYRLGYSTISATTASTTTEGDDFLDIKDFDAAQKLKFYTSFNGADTAHYTPLRGALSKAGQYFANKARSQSSDPVQYSCQRNFTILSTDGYWNTPEESTSSPKYGAYGLDNSTLVGQQDGSGTARPMFDGNTVSSTTTTSWTVTTVNSTTTVTPVTSVTTTTKTTSTFTPTSGFTESSYVLSVRQSPSTISRPPSGNTTITVSTSSPHNFGVAGQTTTAVITGGSVAGYTGTVVITIVDADTFTYKSTTGSRPSNPSGASNYTVSLSGGQSCVPPQGLAVKSTRTHDLLHLSISTATTTSTTQSTLTTIVSSAGKQPYTRVVKMTDSLVTSDTGAAGIQGTLVTTPSTTTTTSTSPVTTSTGVTSAAGADSYSAWVAGGDAVPQGTCVASAPATTTAASATTTGVITQTAGPTTTGPVKTTGTAIITVNSPTMSTSATVTVSSSTSTGGVTNTLADVAAYYYNTDLRNTSLSNCTGALGTDVCTDNVPGQTGVDALHSFGDNAAWQHMTTYTLGLGVSGLLTFNANYQTALSGDFYQITNGTKNWTTPDPSAGPENIDDLWHAAVNGRGVYFSAGDPATLATSLTTALDSIKAITGAAAAASTSSLQPVEGDNDIYVAEFTSQKWLGDVLAYKIDPSTGAISTTTTWSASAQLELKDPASRTIYYPNPSGGSTLRTFTYANLTTDSYNSYFDNFCTKTGAGGGLTPAQCSLLGSTDKGVANTGSNLVNYLRGDQTLGTYYRIREKRLGDIISASPLFVGKPSFKYLENNYTTYQSDNVSRAAVVLAAANDGMVHAFNRLTGNELWAFIPTLMMPKLYRLADTGYPNNHEYFVDGSPQVGDIWTGSAWKTIVVGGLNGGGRSYYALDVTDPALPKLLWEFTNNNLGYTYGNPIITKRSDGTWVVVFASGYNNVSPGDGNGHLFVVNAATGALLTTVDTFTAGTTAAGSTTTPSGLAKINDWIDSETNNLALRYYGGDLLGNLWRFDIDSLVAPFNSALPLAQFKLTDGTPQSITVKPALAEVIYNGVHYPVVYTATGRYLGTTDLASTTTQAVYAIKDPLTNTPYGDVRSVNQLVTQTLTIGTDASGNPTRGLTSNLVDWSTKPGWRADFPATGERVNVNPQLVLNTLFVGTNVPSNNTCTVGGSSFLYKFDIATGGLATGESQIGTYLGNVLIQGLTTVQLSSGGSSPGSIETILTRSDATLQTNQSSNSSSAGVMKRTSWRELIN